MKDQRPESISYSTHVMFTSSNVQKFQHEKPVICPNAQNSWSQYVQFRNDNVYKSNTRSTETSIQNPLQILQIVHSCSADR